MIAGANELHQPIDHILFYGPPGLGKTSLAKIIALETKRNIIYVQGPLLERKSDLLTLLSSFKDNDIVFIDEIHGINKNIEELLYSALEDGVVDVAIGVDGDKRIMRMKLNKFSLIGATTKFNQVSKPLKDRFGFIGKLANYNNSEIEQIVRNSAIRNSIEIDEKSMKQLFDSLIAGDGYDIKTLVVYAEKNPNLTYMADKYFDHNFVPTKEMLNSSSFKFWKVYFTLYGLEDIGSIIDPPILKNGEGILFFYCISVLIPIFQ